MRILAISDVHGSENASYLVQEKVEQNSPDIILVAGDITHFGPPEWAKRFLDALPIRTLAIHGNCDPPEVVDAIEASAAECVHMKRVEVGGITFVGMGGANPPPFPTMSTHSEEEIGERLNGMMERSDVLLTHAPPHGYRDKVFFGKHVGSKAVREAVEAYRPRLVVSGHIHEARGFEEDDGTVFVNPGKAANGYAAVIEFGDAVQVRMLD